MNPYLKYALIAGGAYLIFHDQVNTWLSGLLGTETTPQNENTPEQPAISSSVLSTAALMDAASQNDGFRIAGGGRMSYDHWHYYYKQVRGIDAPAFEKVFPGRDRGLLLSLDEWIAATASHGLAGVPWRQLAWGY